VVGGNFNSALAYDVRLTVEMKDDAERVGGWDDEEEGLAAVLDARLLSTLVEVEKWLKTADLPRSCGSVVWWWGEMAQNDNWQRMSAANCQINEPRQSLA
jgi:hypothetical protein